MGCAVKPAPPAFSLYDHKGMVVTPFVNVSPDDALTAPFQTNLIQELTSLNALTLYEPAQVGIFLTGLSRTPEALPADAPALRALGQRFKSDLILTGSVDAYEESRSESKPSRQILDRKTGKAEWGFYSYRLVTVRVSGKLFDPSTGGLLWTRQAVGSSSDSKWNPLPIPPEWKEADVEKLNEAMRVYRRQAGDMDGMHVTNGDGRLLYLRDSRIAQMRTNAIYQAARNLSYDFKPRGNWTPYLQQQGALTK
jgi:TolB-like protein